MNYSELLDNVRNYTEVGSEVLSNSVINVFITNTEDKIQKAINFLTKGRTTIVIALRLSTILNSDRIYVITKGQITAKGKHEELLVSSHEYKNFYEKQIQK